MTVGDLIGLRHLGIELLAGRGGLDRELSSAQIHDNLSPWDWLDPGDLVVTGGWIVPKDPHEQAHFIERMAHADLAGILISNAPHRPTLSPEMLQAAENRDFPVGSVDPMTSHAEICRLVARTNQQREGRVLNAIMRVHDEVRVRLVSPRSSGEFLDALGKVVHSQLYITNPETWEPLLPGTPTPNPEWRLALSEALKERGGTMPLALALKVDDGPVVALSIQTDQPGLLFVKSSEESPRLALLQHVAAACALEVAGVEAEIYKGWRAGASLLMEGLQGRIDPSAFAARVGELELLPPWTCAVVEASTATLDRIDRYWLVRRTPHLMTSATDGKAVALFATHEDRIAELGELCTTTSSRAGISEPIYGASALGDASRQARWALETLPPGASGLATYGTEAQSFLPRTLLESEQAVARILGPLLTYDTEHEGELVKTLETYLACDRSPKRAAELLFVHNQTVNYRMARIQEMTGRSLRSTADISEFWFALRALALSRTAPDR